MYVLDTNSLIYFFKGLGNVGINLLAKPPKDIGVPAIVLYELETGIKKSQSPQKRIKQLNDLITVVTVLPFGKTEAKAAAQIRADLEKKGTPIGPYDILIGGTALANQATLVTRNVKEFKRIKNLNVIDWY
jgi:tRNA(fMet)-specific endonuclease VapC